MVLVLGMMRAEFRFVTIVYKYQVSIGICCFGCYLNFFDLLPMGNGDNFIKESNQMLTPLFYTCMQGSSNLSVLTETGVKQAERCREALRNISFDRCFSSPISRAKV